MAKRFTDSEKFRDPWFADLPVKMKCFWMFLLDQCDQAGVWKVHLRTASSAIGEDVSEEEIRTHLGDRVVWFGRDRIWVTGFIQFQYGTFKPTNRAHRGIMRALVRDTEGVPLTGPSKALIEGFKETLGRLSTDSHQTLGRGSVDPTGKGKGNGSSSSEDEHRVTAPPAPDPVPLALAGELEACLHEWGSTLTHFDVHRDPKFDEVPLARLIRDYRDRPGWVRHVLIGARLEAGTDTFDPKDHISLTRIFTPKNADKLANLGAREQARLANRESSRRTVEVKIP